MNYYFSKLDNCFYPEDQKELIKEDFIKYTQEEYDTLMIFDEFHYEAQDPETMLPRLYEIDDESKRTILRAKREKNCFPIINRGELWYGNLTKEQREELKVWYKAWLDVTDTLVIPEQPNWI